MQWIDEFIHESGIVEKAGKKQSSLRFAFLYYWTGKLEAVLCASYSLHFVFILTRIATLLLLLGIGMYLSRSS